MICRVLRSRERNSSERIWPVQGSCPELPKPQRWMCNLSKHQSKLSSGPDSGSVKAFPVKPLLECVKSLLSSRGKCGIHLDLTVKPSQGKLSVDCVAVAQSCNAH